MKIAIVGAGSAGVTIVSLFPKELNEDIKIIKVDHYNALKLDARNQATKIDKNQKTTNVGIMWFTYKKLSTEEVAMYLDDPVCDKDEILKLLSMVQDGDKIYYMDEFLGCFGGDHFGFKLTRDGKTVIKTGIFKKLKSPRPQQQSLPMQSKPAKRGIVRRIVCVIFSIFKYKV